MNDLLGYDFILFSEQKIKRANVVETLKSIVFLHLKKFYQLF